MDFLGSISSCCEQTRMQNNEKSHTVCLTDANDALLLLLYSLDVPDHKPAAEIIPD